MFRNAWLKPVVVCLAALAAVLSLPCSKAEAQVKPFKVTGGGLAPEGISLIPGVAAPHWAVGISVPSNSGLLRNCDRL